MNQDRWLTANYGSARWLFLRGMGLIYLFAFLSLWVQLEGLIGSDGILPAADYLRQIGQQLGGEAYVKVPTLAWMTASDWFLHILCASGVLCALLLILNYAPALLSFLLWILYLSLVLVGQNFFGFQWDNLLLEAGFLSIFLAPWSWNIRHSSTQAIPKIALWLGWLLLFKVLFSSGIVKIQSGDPVWHNLTALNYHYETQPLPTLFGWIIHQFPPWFDTISTALMFVIEIVIPFLIFIPVQKVREIAFWSVTGLMGLIFITGNYCFFNLLTINLALLLLSDQTINSWLPQRWHNKFSGSPKQSPGLPHLSVVFLYGLFYMVICSYQLLNLFVTRHEQPLTLWRGQQEVPQWVQTFQTPATWASQSFRSINEYGLFANMTTKRYEIIVQGSRDGQHWKNYTFEWKPGDPQGIPGWVQPHQPRLDWQMWFAALSNYRQNPWFVRFLVRLLQDKKAVVNLIERNPFPDQPPQYIRAVAFQYHFTDWSTLWNSGQWWTRQRKGLYCPAFSLEQIPQRMR